MVRQHFIRMSLFHEYWTRQLWCCNMSTIIMLQLFEVFRVEKRNQKLSSTIRLMFHLLNVWFCNNYAYLMQEIICFEDFSDIQGCGSEIVTDYNIVILVFYYDDTFTLFPFNFCYNYLTLCLEKKIQLIYVKHRTYHSALHSHCQQFWFVEAINELIPISLHWQQLSLNVFERKSDSN